MATRTEMQRNRGEFGTPVSGGPTVDIDIARPAASRVSWGAVFAGVSMALAVQLILNMLGLGVGAATIDPATGENPSAASFSVGAAIWWTVSGLIASFIGGVVAARMAGEARESNAGLHGLTVWAFSTLVIFYLMTTTVGALTGGFYRVVSDTASGVTQTMGGAAQSALQAALPAGSNPFAAIEEEINNNAGPGATQDAREAAIAAMRALVTGDPAQQAQAEQEAAQAIARAQGISEDEARTQVQQYMTQYQQTFEQTQQQAAQAADVTANAVSRGAIFGAIALMLGALAAWLGGRLGAVREDPVSFAPGPSTESYH